MHAIRIGRLYEYGYKHTRIITKEAKQRLKILNFWRIAVKEFFQNVNKIIQDLIINLIALILFIIQYALYLLIIIIVAKYGWKIAKDIWKK